MIRFTTIIQQFQKQGEKTGWTYITITNELATCLYPGNKKSFRVKGKLDEYVFKGIALLPMGNGEFIMPLNITIRKAIKKRKGALLQVQIEADYGKPKLSGELLECLADEPAALANFNKLSRSHQNYYSNWIKSAKTEATKAKRIVMAVSALEKGFHYGQMIRWNKDHTDNH